MRDDTLGDARDADPSTNHQWITAFKSFLLGFAGGSTEKEGVRRV